MWIKQSVLCQCLLLLLTAVYTLADVSHLSRRRGEQRAKQVRANDGHYDANDDGTEWDLRLAVPGEPGRDYPVLAAIPRTVFSCSGRSAGYYADVDTNCQVFRICTTGATFGYQSFLCPNGTLFNQEYLVCDWWMHVKCSASENYYNKNDKFGSLKVGPQMMNDVQKMIMYPMMNPLNSNSLGDDKMVMQLYNPPSGQISLPFNHNDQYNVGPRGPNTYYPNTNNPLAQYVNAASLPPSQYNENAFSASTPSTLYMSQSEPLNNYQQDHSQTFSITPSKELEVTFKKQQYTYPSQYDKQVTYKLSQLANNNQNTLYNLANLQHQKQIAEAQRNLVSGQDQTSESSLDSNNSSHSTTVLSGTLVTKSLTINKEIKVASQTAPRPPSSRVLFKTWAPRTTKFIPTSARQYLAPTKAPKYLAPLTLPLEEQSVPYQPFKKSARLTDATTSPQSKCDDNNIVPFSEILTKDTLDDTVSKIVEETSRIIKKTPLEMAAKLKKEVPTKAFAITTYLPANDFDEANDVENIDQPDLKPIKLTEQKSGRLTNAPSDALEPPTRVTGNIFKKPSQLTTLPYYKKKVTGQIPEINYVSPNSLEKSISVKLSLPEKIVSYVLNARNYTNLDHLEVLNNGDSNYLLLTNGNANKDRKFIPLGKLVFANPFNVSDSQGHAFSFLENNQNSQYQQQSNAQISTAAINNLNQNTKLINEQNKQILSQLSQLNLQQQANKFGNSHTFEQLRVQDDVTSTNGAAHNSENIVYGNSGQLTSGKSGLVRTGQGNQIISSQGGQLANEQTGQFLSSHNGQLVSSQLASGQNGQQITTQHNQFGSSQSGKLITSQTGPQVSGKLVSEHGGRLSSGQFVSGQRGHQVNGQMITEGQAISNQNNRLVSEISHNYNQDLNTKTFAQGPGVSGQLRQYNENEVIRNSRPDFQITNQKSQNANSITHRQNQNAPQVNTFTEPLPNVDQDGNFYSSQFSSGNPGDTLSQKPNTYSNQSGKLRVSGQTSRLYHNPENQNQNVLSLDNRNGQYISGVFDTNNQLSYNQPAQTTKATSAVNSDVETFSPLEVQVQSGKLQAPTMLPTINTVSQVSGKLVSEQGGQLSSGKFVSGYQVTNLAGANANFPNSFGQYRSVQNDQYNLVGTTRQTPQKENVVTYSGDQSYSQNPDVNINTSGRYRAQPVQPTVPREEEITTTVQFIPSLSFELNDENEQENFFAALKNGIIGDEAPINRVDSGNTGLGYVFRSPLENVRSAPISSVGYEVRHSPPIQRTQDYTAAVSSYSGPSSYLAPQSSVGKLYSAAPVATAQRVQPKDVSREYIPQRLEDLSETVGYPRQRPSIPFTF